MIITDHITTGIPSPLIGPNIDGLGTRFPDMSEVYSKRLRDIIRKNAKECNIEIQEGVYVQFTGPNYETPAEVRLAQRWGGDAVGMSTACEAMAAHHMGLETCGISCITNMAAGISKEQLNHKEVQETADLLCVHRLLRHHYAGPAGHIPCHMGGPRRGDSPPAENLRSGLRPPTLKMKG